ncbi:Leucine rich repeat protein [Handroanthus impetiginosus]|uniref:Leucine rich repeat protein n=1 Tax=Handroanthus impetiginosus TaxID=429701 RepID=A0A2G9G2Y0_9LAMI|nr:Leucine rich repeat protein [Handroanthus impetiginosus]
MDQILVKKARIGMEKKVLQEEDTIGSLPDHILHEIMSLLPPRYAAITSVLSHRWLKIWLTFPSIQLDETKFSKREQFLHCLRATLARRNLLYLQKLRLQRLRPGSLELYQLINRFMDVVLSKGALKILEITFLHYVHLRYEQLYVLAKEMFSLCSSLIALRIEGCRFEGCEPVNLPSLKTLLMKNVTFENQDFLQELIQGCPVLENLSTKYCNGIKNLRVFHPTLQRFVLGFCGEMESLELDVPCVKSIKFKALDHFYDELTQVLRYEKIWARNVQTLRLKHFTMRSEELHNIISFFPKIEKLNMRCCEVLGVVKVLSNSLTTLRMSACIFQEEVEIEAPNLQAITYLHNSRGPKLDNMIFRHLTRIFLANVQVSWILCINNSTCPNLESLDLISCKNMKKLRIASSKLESLNVSECEDLEFFMIVALQLSYFSYSGQVVSTYQIVASMNLQVMLHLKGPQGYHDHVETELHKFTQFLHKFDVSAKAVTIRLSYDCAMVYVFAINSIGFDCT